MNNEFLTKLFFDQKFRREATRQNHSLFFNVYMHDYVKYPTANFQKEMFFLTEKESAHEIFVVAFRGSAKSTIFSLSYPIWAMLGKQEKKFIVILSQTQNQSRLILNNLKRELETNQLLIKDFGLLSETSREWSTNSLDIVRYGTRITAASSGETIRGLRHGSYRPDLIICDDVEDIASIKTLENRQRTHEWFTSEVLPLGDFGTRLVVVGNMLHEDSLMMKLKEYDENVGRYSVFIEYPLVDDDGIILWPEKYTQTAIDELRRSSMNDHTFEREYLLKIVPDDEQIIHREWIKYYDFPLPAKDVKPPREILIAVDLAIKKGAGRDFTTAVPFYLTGFDKELQAYVLPFIINKQLDFPETVAELEKLSKELQRIFNVPPKIYVESVGYQDAVVQQLLTVNKLSAEPVGVGGLDKISRLRIVSPYVQTGKVFFPKYGSETLLNQLLNIHSTKHDDLADAFSIGMSKIIQSDRPYYPWRGPIEHEPDFRFDPMMGEYRDMNLPITAGLLDMVF
jgi:phage terminase large subunit-like protein